MNAQIESSSIQEALRVALRLAPPMSGNVTLEADGTRLLMHSVAELSRCSVVLPGTVKGKAYFAVATDALSAATKGHAELEMAYDKTMLKIKSGRYSADLTTVDAVQLEELEKEKGQIWKLSPEQGGWLKNAVAAVALKPSQLLATGFMPVTAKLTEKAAFVACYDNQRMSFINDKEITGSLEVTLPLETFNAVLDTFHKAKFTMTVGSSTLFIKNAIVEVQLSLPEKDEENQIGTDDVIGKAREASKIDGSELQLSKAEITAFLDNARAVATKERSEIKIATDTGKAKLSVATTNGTSKTILKAQTPKKATAFNIDFEFFDEVVRKCPDDVIFKVVQGAFLMFKTRQAQTLVALNQE